MPGGLSKRNLPLKPGVSHRTLQRMKACEWRLSPAYDITYAYNEQGECTSSCQMSANRKWVDIHDADWFVVAGWSRYAQSAAVSGGQAKKLRGF